MNWILKSFLLTALTLAVPPSVYSVFYHVKCDFSNFTQLMYEKKNRCRVHDSNCGYPRATMPRIHGHYATRDIALARIAVAKRPLSTEL